MNTGEDTPFVRWLRRYRRVWIGVGIVVALCIVGAATSTNDDQPVHHKKSAVEQVKDKAAKEQGATSEAKATQKPREQPAQKPEKPQQTQKPDLYGRAVVTRPPAYTVADQQISNNHDPEGKRVDAFVVTNRTDDKTKLGAVMTEMQVGSDADLLTVYFFASRSAYNRNVLFADGSLAMTAVGKSYLTGQQDLSQVGKFPVLTITLDS